MDDSFVSRTTRGLQRMSLRAYDLSGRAARRGRASQRSRVARWRSRLFMLAQMSIAAGLAWFLGQRLLGHEVPFFAMVSAILCLGLSFGQRWGRVVEVCVGVAVGVLCGDLLVAWVGIGVWQIMLVVFVATSVATWLGAQRLMMTQAAVQAATVMTLFPNPEAGLGRWLDAVIGGAVALVFATVAPTGPLHQPRLQAAKVLQEASATLRGLREALRTGDQDAAEIVLARARASESLLAALSTAADEGIAVVRYSPFLRGRRGDMQVLADLVTPLDFMLRDLRVLSRRGVVALFRGEPVPGGYLDLIDLCVLMDVCAGELYAHRPPTAVQRRLVAFAEKTSTAAPVAGLSSAVILAQLRSMTADLLELTGMSAADAREALPDVQV